MNKLNKLHLGCGERYLEGYLHIDINEFEHIDYKTKVDNLDMFDENSIEEIYASHLLEYFDIYESIEVLNEWKRVLIKGGKLRLAVPNFTNLIEVYKKTGSIADIIGPIIGRWELSNNDLIYHKQIFDEKSLEGLLIKSGFKNIKQWDWREFTKEHPNFDDHSQAYFPHMDKENGIHVSLNVICIK